MGDATNTTCQECGGPAWMGAYTVRCINIRCRNYDAETRGLWIEEWAAGQLSENRTTDPAVLDWDEDTDPQWRLGDLDGEFWDAWRELLRGK